MAINKLIGEGYKGEFIIELYPNVSIDFLRAGGISFFQNGDKIRISHGSAKQSMGGIQMYSYGKPFHFGYPHMKKITADNGDILWQNWNEK